MWKSITTGHYLPCRISLFQVHGVYGRTTLIRGRFEKKADIWLWYSFCITCIKTLNLNICLY